uniref:Phospholipid transport system substrate-binding protein n=1 Tax=Candidatus Kentrum sp. TUN TaxID=2126343 RepID=A0A450ZQE2_9GAMM|nr:MAG: phospholipid transport system substrate-binding protein [Candidatus Kentron sp. TUN]VFK58228.1 MAG: phospholipid transport system substrate-binding protein [Candidatus Kentron sp. TUN]VFK62146.1 MAG: phospholipid transport system substrate-binding protein [Candidatus Kentron sp. TUN]
MNHQSKLVCYSRFLVFEVVFHGAMRFYWIMILLLFPLAHEAYADRPPKVVEDSHEQAGKVVQDTSKRLFESIEREGLRVDKDQKRLYQLVDEIVFEKFDFRRMSSRVLGRNWRKATLEQKRRFIEQFKAHLVFNYTKALNEYSGQEIEYFPVQSKPSSSGIKVRTRVQLTGRPPIEIDYMLLRSREGGWKVVDVLVAGVSLIITYRSSFQAEIDQIGISGLIAKLKRNNSRVLSKKANYD